MKNMKVDERELDRIQAIMLSMTPEERRRPELIKGSRRLRIAKGSGTNVQQVNQLVKQFGQMRKVMKQIGAGQDAGPRRARCVSRPAEGPRPASARLLETLMAVRLRLTRMGGQEGSRSGASSSPTSARRATVA